MHMQMLNLIQHEYMLAPILFVGKHVLVWYMHILLLFFVFVFFPTVSHSLFSLPHTLADCKTLLIIHSQILCIEIIKGGFKARFPHGNVPHFLPFWCTFGIFQIKGETISSWHIINCTCRRFPLGYSSGTSENKSPDVILNQSDTTYETGKP